MVPELISIILEVHVYLLSPSCNWLFYVCDL